MFYILRERSLIAGLLPICSSGLLGARSERLMSYKASLPNQDAQVIRGGMDVGRLGKRNVCLVDGTIEGSETETLKGSRHSRRCGN